MKLTARQPAGAILLFAALHLPSHAATNAWTGQFTGLWHDLSWSLNTRPTVADDATVITNAGSKTIIVDSETAGSYPASLQIRNLVISSPPGSTNVVLLNSLGGQPLTVQQSSVLGPGGTLVNLYSSLGCPAADGSLILDGGTFIQEGGTTIISNLLAVGRSQSGQVAFTNGTLFAREIVLGKDAEGEFIQAGGEVTSDFLDVGYSRGTYHQESGLLSARRLRLGERDLSATGFAVGQFHQNGGTSIVEEVSLGHTGGSGSFDLAAGVLAIRDLRVGSSGDGAFSQHGGRSAIQSVSVGLSPTFGSGSFHLANGELTTDFVRVGESGNGSFQQTGGRHFAAQISILGDSYRWAGSYRLVDGILEAEQLSISLGVMAQSGGTNRVLESMGVGRSSSYSLTGGLLVSSGCSIEGGPEPGGFHQSGGDHVLPGLLNVSGGYNLSGGNLIVSEIFLSAGGTFTVTNGIIAENAAFTFSRGSLSSSVPQLTLGALELKAPATSSFEENRINFTGTFGIITFADSSASIWGSGEILTIAGWNGSAHGGGAHQLLIGHSRSLTAGQLASLHFANPAGAPAGIYPAAQLDTGEIVPQIQNDTEVEFTKIAAGLFLSWPNTWTLEFSTEANGPYLPLQNVQSPYTNSLSGARGFFRLRMAE